MNDSISINMNQLPEMEQIWKLFRENSLQSLEKCIKLSRQQIKFLNLCLITRRSEKQFCKHCTTQLSLLHSIITQAKNQKRIKGRTRSGLRPRKENENFTDNIISKLSWTDVSYCNYLIIFFLSIVSV